MKRLNCLLLCLFISIALMKAENYASLYRSFNQAAGVEQVSISRLAMMLMKPFMGDDPVASSIQSIQVLDLSSCSDEVRLSFNKRAARINERGFETLMQVKEEEEFVRILVKTKQDRIRELVILITGGDPVLVRSKGNLSMDEAQKMAPKC